MHIGMNPNQLVNLEILESARDAMILVSKIEAAGIFVSSYNAWPLPFVPRALGGIQIKVRAADYDVAKAIMDDALPDRERPITALQFEIPTILVFASTIVLLIWQISITQDLMQVDTQSRFNGVILAAFFVWFVAIHEAIRTTRRWWLLASLPIVITPLAVFALLSA